MAFLLMRLLRCNRGRGRPSAFLIIGSLLLLPGDHFLPQDQGGGLVEYCHENIGDAGGSGGSDGRNLERNFGAGFTNFPRREENNNQLWLGMRLGMGIVVTEAVAAPDATPREGKKLRELFIADVQSLLTHYQTFYNTYGYKDDAVDEAFKEARMAAHVIYFAPQVFQTKIDEIYNKISKAIRKKDKGNVFPAVTADGVWVSHKLHVLSKCMYLLSKD